MRKKRKNIRNVNAYRQLFYLWMFISQEGLWDEAREFIEENMDTPIPFESAKELRNT